MILPYQIKPMIIQSTAVMTVLMMEHHQRQSLLRNDVSVSLSTNWSETPKTSFDSQQKDDA